MGNAGLDAALGVLAENKTRWARLPIGEKITYLKSVSQGTADAARDWVAAAVEAKGLDLDAPLAGEEWMSGPYALLNWLVAMQDTLEALAEGRDPLEGIKVWARPDGQVVARVYPKGLVEGLLLSGYTADVWMDPEIDLDSLSSSVAAFYRVEDPEGSVALVLGVGNISSIAPLDLLYKLFVEGDVAIVKLSPVNDYLLPFFERIFASLIDAGFVHLTTGDADVGAYLTSHHLVDRVHITGSERTHDAIVFGTGDEGAERKERNEPILTKPITSELGGVGPTIVVPGPWTDADFAFQAEHIATQKLHNDGFNCIASQVLVLPAGWDGNERLLQELRKTIAAAEDRPAYYPGALERADAAFAEHPQGEHLGTAMPRSLIVGIDAADAGDTCFNDEVFAPVLATTELPGKDASAFLRAAVEFANETLYGTLGANVIVHPKTAKGLGAALDQAIADLRFGTVAVNAWTGVGYLVGRAPWGAYSGSSLNDIQSGIGVVHNALMFDHPQKTVVHGPFRPFHRAITGGEFHLSPRPPWFITNKTAHKTAERLTYFAYDVKVGRLPGIFASALRG